MTKTIYVDRLKDDLTTVLDLISLASITASTAMIMKDNPNFSEFESPEINSLLTEIEIESDKNGQQLSEILHESLTTLTDDVGSNKMLLDSIIKMFEVYNLSSKHSNEQHKSLLSLKHLVEKLRVEIADKQYANHGQ